MMTRKQTVFKQAGPSFTGVVAFTCTDNEENDLLNTHLILDAGIWEKMEKPALLTVTIEVGDKLNGINNESHNNG